MAGVFVSYAREDAPKAKALARAFEDASIDVWIDERIQSGSEFASEIEQALGAATAVVVLWSKDSVASPWVRDEAAEGRDSGRLVPILLDDSRPPIGFRQFQATDLSHWSGRGRPKQLDDVIAAIGAKAGAPAQRRGPVVVRSRFPTRRIGWIAAGSAAVLLTIAALLFPGRFDTDPASAPSLAILPFTADASDAEARKLAFAAHDAVAHTLSRGAFAVSAIDAASPDRPAPADYLLKGQVTSTPDKFVTTVRMEEATHHFVVFSHQFESSRDKVGDSPELIGAQVASQVSWTAPLIAVDRRHPTDPAVLAALLQASSAGLESVGALYDYENARRIAAKAPKSPLALNQLAFNTAFALEELPREDRSQAIAAARSAVDRSIEIAPEFGGAYIPWCFLHSEQRMTECEAYLRRGMKAEPDAPFNNFFLSRFLNGAGANSEATDLAKLSLAHDSYMPFKIAQALRMFEVSGRTEDAESLYRQSVRWWPENQTIDWHRASGMLMRGDFDAALRFETGAGSPPDPVVAAIRSRSLPDLRKLCAAATREDFKTVTCMLGLARLGDLDLAFTLADRAYPSRRGRTRAEEDRIWIDAPGANPLAFLTAPVASPLRRDPRYLPLVERTGLLEYWRSGRPPDFCRPPKAEPICPRLLRRA